MTSMGHDFLIPFNSLRFVHLSVIFLIHFCLGQGYSNRGLEFPCSPAAFECHSEEETFYEARKAEILSHCGSTCDTQNRTGRTHVVNNEKNRKIWVDIESFDVGSPFLAKPVDCFSLWQNAEGANGAVRIPWPPPNRPPCPLFADFTMEFSMKTEAWYRTDHDESPHQNEDDHPNERSWDWSVHDLDHLVRLADNREYEELAYVTNSYGGWAAAAVAEGIDQLFLGDSGGAPGGRACPESVAKRVLVIGSESPWVEALLLSKRASAAHRSSSSSKSWSSMCSPSARVEVTTLEYAHLNWEPHPQLRTTTYLELRKEFLAGTLEAFDAVVSHCVHKKGK
jgi:hypothetical protein